LDSGIWSKIGLVRFTPVFFFSHAWKCSCGGLLVTKYLRDLVQSVFLVRDDGNDIDDEDDDDDEMTILCTMSRMSEMRWDVWVGC
jgi:hypothetical protein